MSEFPKPTLGQRVRVVLEGEVTWVGHDDRFALGTGVVYPRAVVGGPVKSIEILPQPLKVGDDVVVADRNDDLPVGTVLRGPAGDVLVRKWDGWKTAGATGTYPSDGLNATRTILWLPKS